MDNRFNNSLGKAPKPLWPWIAGAAILIGTAKVVKDTRKSHINVRHTPSSTFNRPKTSIDVKKDET